VPLVASNECSLYRWRTTQNAARSANLEIIGASVLILQEFRRLKRAILGSFSFVARTCEHHGHVSKANQSSHSSNPAYESYQHTGILIASSNTTRCSFTWPRRCECEDETSERKLFPSSCNVQPCLNDNSSSAPGIIIVILALAFHTSSVMRLSKKKSTAAQMWRDDRQQMLFVVAVSGLPSRATLH